MPSSLDNLLHLFDCDGVILDSNNSKVTALEGALEAIGCPEALMNWTLNEFRANFGRTRSQHFEIFMQHFCLNGFLINTEDMNKVKDHYSSGVKELYKTCNLIQETFEYLSQLNNKENIFVVSASDQDELRNVLPNKSGLFEVNRVFGGPENKLNNIIKILNGGNMKAILYGDSVQDAKAALSANISFVGLTKYSADPDGLNSFCNANDLTVRADLGGFQHDQ